MLTAAGRSCPSCPDGCGVVSVTSSVSPGCAANTRQRPKSFLKNGILFNIVLFVLFKFETVFGQMSRLCNLTIICLFRQKTWGNHFIF